MALNRLWVEKTAKRRVQLEKQIVELLKVELALMQKKKELYEQYTDLVDAATNAYQNQRISASQKDTPYIKY